MPVLEFLLAFLVMLSFTGVSGALTYWLARRDIGPHHAWAALDWPRTLPFVCGVALVALLTGYGVEYAVRNFTEAAGPLFVLLMLALLWGLIIRAGWRRAHDGRVLVDIGAPTNTLLTALVVLCGVPVVVVFASFATRWDWFVFLTLLFWGSAFIFILLWRLVSVRFTTLGVSSFAALHKWSEITAYAWVGTQNTVLSLQISTVFLGQKSPSATYWRIPPQHRPAVAQVLAQYLPHLSPPTSTANRSSE